MKAMLQRAWRDTLDVVFPRNCVSCGGAVEEGRLRHLCPGCAARVHIVEAPHCSTCGHPFYGEMAANRVCEHCETLVPEYGEGKTAILAKGPGRALVHALKYHQAFHILEDVRTLMAMAPGYATYLRGKVLVPVPLHPRKLRERGYNQCMLLAEMATQVAEGQAKIEQLLVRAVDTETQTKFDRERRRTNLKNAFAMAPGAVITPGQHYLLIDDVFTTGSTLNACAAVLRRAGAVNLDVVTFGHG